MRWLPWVAAMPARGCLPKDFDWQIPDPKNMEPAEFNKVRDLISEKVKALLAEL
jgi:protein-tyrosine-phosphatase